MTDAEVRAAWESLTPEQREKLLDDDPDWSMPDLFDWDENYDPETGEEDGWFAITDLGRRTRAYGESLT